MRPANRNGSLSLQTGNTEEIATVITEARENTVHPYFTDEHFQEQFRPGRKRKENVQDKFSQ